MLWWNVQIVWNAENILNVILKRICSKMNVWNWRTLYVRTLYFKNFNSILLSVLMGLWKSNFLIWENLISTNFLSKKHYILKVQTESVDCSTVVLLSACPTSKTHKDLNQVVATTALPDIMTHWPKTSSNTTIELVTFCAISLSWIKCLYNFSSSVIWWKNGHRVTLV
jgi:hypothetical protein